MTFIIEEYYIKNTRHKTQHTTTYKDIHTRIESGRMNMKKSVAPITEYDVYQEKLLFHGKITRNYVGFYNTLPSRERIEKLMKRSEKVISNKGKSKERSEKVISNKGKSKERSPVIK